MDERELLLLGLLKREEMHGYQLSQFLEHRLDSVVPMKRSTAYFLLNKLAERGLVREETDREGRRPERRVYRLTPAGDATFAESLRDHLGRHASPHFPDAVGLLFMDFISPHERVELLRRRLQQVEDQADHAEDQARAHATTPVLLAMSYRASVLRSERDWLKSTIERLSLESGTSDPLPQSVGTGESNR